MGVPRQDHVKLHTQCSKHTDFRGKEDEGGENRESKFSVAHTLAPSNKEVVQDPGRCDSVAYKVG